VELERGLAREDRRDDLSVLARAGQRIAVGDAVPALDDLRPGRAEPEQEAAAGEVISIASSLRR
jgi:hypothetical protein